MLHSYYFNFLHIYYYYEERRKITTFGLHKTIICLPSKDGNGTYSPSTVGEMEFTMNINLTKTNKSLRKTEKKVLKKARKFHKDNTVICAAAEAVIVGGTIYGVSKSVKRSVIKDLQLDQNNQNQNPQPTNEKSFFEKIPVVGKTITKIKDKKQQKKNQNPADDKNNQNPPKDDDKKSDKKDDAKDAA